MMGCCGDKRQQWQQSMMTYQEPAQAIPEPVMENPVELQYDGRSTVMVKGKQTGFLYIFAPGEQGLAVDGRDVPQILSESKKFTLANSDR